MYSSNSGFGMVWVSVVVEEVVVAAAVVAVAAVVAGFDLGVT